MGASKPVFSLGKEEDFYPVSMQSSFCCFSSSLTEKRAETIAWAWTLSG